MHYFEEAFLQELTEGKQFQPYKAVETINLMTQHQKCGLTRAIRSTTSRPTPVPLYPRGPSLLDTVHI